MHLFFVVALAAAAGDSSPIDFDTDVLPILTKAGCNAAACHGAAAGRGSFKLSLFGGDAARDYDEIVHRLEGRRINLVKPQRSLVLLKPTEQLDHEGGLRLAADSDEAKVIGEWIRQGAGREQVRRLVDLKLNSNDVQLSKMGDSVQLEVQAVFDDGSVRDVTRRSIYWPDDPAAVEVDDAGMLRVNRRGRQIVVVRYLTIVKTVAVTVPLTDEPVDVAAVPVGNWIDDEILAMLKRLGLPPSPPADDAALLRRARLDLTGRLPSPQEVTEYLADRDPRKSERLVDRLLESDDFTDYWTFQLAKLLRVRSQAKEADGARAFHGWIRAQLDRRTPLNQMATDLITAEGDTHVNGPANFYLAAGGPREQAEYVSEVLLGVRLRCANCHNHPLDQWTQDDYHGLAAVFARIERGRVIRVSARGEVTHPRTGEAAAPRIPGARFIGEEEDGRQVLADWLTDRDNPYLARAMVNRLWKSLLGRGLVEPADDLRATNPATHPALLDRLARDFVDHDYDVRHTLRLIATSATYARSHRANSHNAADDRFYSHAIEKPLDAEVLADVIADVTGVAETYGDQPAGTRAIDLFDSRIESAALDILGRCSREESCEAAGSSAGGISKMLHLINGDLLNKKITDDQGRLRRAIQDGNTNDEIVAEFYQRALGREPTPAETAHWKKALAAADDDRAQRLEDFLWSLLCSREFSLNH